MLLNHFMHITDFTFRWSWNGMVWIQYKLYFRRKSRRGSTASQLERFYTKEWEARYFAKQPIIPRGEAYWNGLCPTVKQSSDLWLTLGVCDSSFHLFLKWWVPVSTKDVKGLFMIDVLSVSTLFARKDGQEHWKAPFDSLEKGESHFLSV